MSLVMSEYEWAYVRERHMELDLSFVNFVAKIQKAKTRKDKDYFVMRITVPKDVAEKMDAKPGDYVFFRAKKAEWYHMLDWEKMNTTWKMLPDQIKNRAIQEGISYPGAPSQTTIPEERMWALGATNPTNRLTKKELMEIYKTIYRE